MRYAIAALVAMLVASLPLVAQFRASVEAVRVDVLVTDAGRPVAGLKVDDFELRDSGVVQDIHAGVLEDVPLRVMLALDTSGSVSGPPLAHLRQAASAAVNLLMPEDHAALITFAGVVTLECPWTSDRRRILAAINRASAGGSTTLYDATYAALTLRDPEPGRTLVLVFSDGADRASWLSGERVLDIARRNEAVVYAATLDVPGNSVHGYRLDFHTGLQSPLKPGLSTPTLTETFLDALTEDTGGKVVNAEASDRLTAVFSQILHEFRSRYLLMYTPWGVEAGGWHPIDVRLKSAKGKVTARRGYLR